MLKRMGLSGPVTVSPRLYERMRRTITGRRQHWGIVGLVIGGVAALLSAFFSRNAGLSWFGTAAYALNDGMIGLLVVLTLVVALDAVDWYGVEDRLIGIVLKALALEQPTPDEDALEAAITRATVGAGAGQLRAVLPVLLFSMLGSGMGALIVSFWRQEDSTGYRASGVLLVAFLAFLFVVMLDQANTDVVLVHALVEYRAEVRRKKRTEEQSGCSMQMQAGPVLQAGASGKQRGGGRPQPAATPKQTQSPPTKRGKRKRR